MTNAEPDSYDGETWVRFEEQLRRVHAGGWAIGSIVRKVADAEFDLWLGEVRARELERVADEVFGMCLADAGALRAEAQKIRSGE